MANITDPAKGRLGGQSSGGEGGSPADLVELEIPGSFAPQFRIAAMRELESGAEAVAREAKSAIESMEREVFRARYDGPEPDPEKAMSDVSGTTGTLVNTANVALQICACQTRITGTSDAVIFMVDAACRRVVADELGEMVDPLEGGDDLPRLRRLLSWANEEIDRLRKIDLAAREARVSG
jgi:hypothetical protein